MDKFTLFRAATGVANLVFAFDGQKVGGEPLWLEDLRYTKPNGEFGQTSQGLLLEVSYGKPRELLTPWGAWHFAGSSKGPWEKVLPNILGLLGVHIDFPILSELQGRRKIFALHKFGDLELPEPIECTKENRRSPHECASEWQVFSRQKEIEVNGQLARLKHLWEDVRYFIGMFIQPTKYY